MKRFFFIICCLLLTTLVFARPVQITVKPDAAQATAQVFEKGSQISGSNGIFRLDIGFNQEKTLTVKADGFDSQTVTVRFKDKQDNYEVVLKPNRKKAVVTTNVTDATIYIDGEEKGKGSATFDIYKNSQKNIKIVADGYETYTGSIGFTESPDMVINKECLIYPNRKDVYISVAQVGAKVFADGKLAGVVAKETPVKLTIYKGKPVSVRVTCEGYMDVSGEINFSDKDVNYDLGSMPEDEAYNATDQKSSDIANTIIPIKVRTDMDRDAALRTMMYYITSNFRNLDVNNYEAGWIRTKWNVDKFPTMQVRTRIELKQAPSDGDGLLKFDLLMESQIAAPNATTDDQNFKEWNLVLKKYKKISEDIRKSVETINTQN